LNETAYGGNHLHCFFVSLVTLKIHTLKHIDSSWSVVRVNGKHQNKTAAGPCINRENHLATPTGRIKRVRSVPDTPGKRSGTLPQMQTGNHDQVQYKACFRIAGRKQRSFHSKIQNHLIMIKMKQEKYAQKRNKKQCILYLKSLLENKIQLFSAD